MYDPVVWQRLAVLLVAVSRRTRDARAPKPTGRGAEGAAERGGPQLQLRVVDAAMPRAAADACDARAHYIASIGSFRLGASTWSNLWHGLTELVAIAGHVLTSVGCEAARCFEPSARKVLYVHSSAEQDAASGVPRDANPILRLLLGRAIFASLACVGAAIFCMAILEPTSLHRRELKENAASRQSLPNRNATRRTRSVPP